MTTNNAPPRLRSQSTPPGEANIPVVTHDSPGSNEVENMPSGTAVTEADVIGSGSKFSLRDIGKCQRKNQHNLFITNLPQVFQYCMKDVLETLNTLDMDVLNHIHKTLADRVKSNFCQYKDRRAVAYTAAKDIWSLGLCITNGLPTRDLDKILILSQNKTGDADSSIDGGDESQRLVNF